MTTPCERLQKKFAARARTFDAQREASMRQGPRFLEDGVFLYVPEEPGHNKLEATRFWDKQGFIIDYSLRVVRDTRMPWRGKVYSPEMWLRSIRRRFYEFYPEFAPE